jgi:hypothetical protein
MSEAFAAGADELGSRLADVGAQRTLWDPAAADWADVAMTVLETLAAADVDFDADDLRRRAGEPPSPGAIGAVFRLAARRGLIQRVDVRRSGRVRRRGGFIFVWRGRR